MKYLEKKEEREQLAKKVTWQEEEVVGNLVMEGKQLGIPS